MGVMRSLSKATRAFLSFWIASWLLLGPLATQVLAGDGYDDIDASRQRRYERRDDRRNDRWDRRDNRRDERRDRRDDPRDDRREDRRGDRKGKKDDGNYSQGEAIALAGASAAGVALSGVALSYLLPMVIGPMAWVPTALIWGSAAVAAPLFTFLYNKFLGNDMNDKKGIGLLTVGGLGLLATVAAGTMFPVAGLAAGLIGTAVGSAVGLPIFQAMAVDDDGKGSDDYDDDDSDYDYPTDDEVDEVWDQYEDLEELYTKLTRAYNKFRYHSREGNGNRAELWLKRYRKLEKAYRRESRDYREMQEEIDY